MSDGNKNDGGPTVTEVVTDIGKDLGKSLVNWVLMMLGIIVVAGGVGTGLGLILGAPFELALIMGAGAIILVLVIYALIKSDTGLF